MLLRFVFLVAFVLLLLNPWVIPWLGDFTGSTAWLQDRGFLTGQQLNDFIVTIVVLVLIPIFGGLIVVIGISIQVTAMVIRNRLERTFRR